MEKPQNHLFVCASFRVKGEPQGVCFKKGSVSLLGYIEEGILDRGLDCRVSATGCLKQCDQGPIVVAYPAGDWYGGVDSEDAIDAILDAMEAGEKAGDYLISE